MKALEEWRLRRPMWFADTIINFPLGEGEGWSEIVDELLQQIESIVLPHTMLAIRIGQIKEKAGSLRLYFRLNEEDADFRPKISDLIELARHRSEQTCMICGAAGERSGAPGCMLSLDELRCPNRRRG